MENTNEVYYVIQDRPAAISYVNANKVYDVTQERQQQ